MFDPSHVPGGTTEHSHSAEATTAGTDHCNGWTRSHDMDGALDAQGFKIDSSRPEAGVHTQPHATPARATATHANSLESHAALRSWYHHDSVPVEWTS